ncbi:MAG: ABC transporter permease [Nitrospinota bacterium]
MLNKLKELYSFRELLKNLVIKELKLRYKRSFLGFFWTMLNPLMMMIILTIVFSQLMRFDMKNFAIFLLCGLLPWNYFSQSISMATTSLISNANLINRVYIPKAIFPLSIIFSNMVNMVLSLIPLFLLMIIIGVRIQPSILLIPVLLLNLMFFTAGISLFISCLNVFFRDFTHMIEIIITAWFYVTPIIYPLEKIPAQYEMFFKLNPLIYIIGNFREVIFYGRIPDFSFMLNSLFASVISFVMGYWYFYKNEKQIIFYI